MMSHSLRLFLLISFHMAALLLSPLCFAETTADVSTYPGYTNDVEQEKAQRFYEVYLFAAPPAEKNLKDAIFSPLTKEFQNRYIEKFGVVDTDALNYMPMNYSSFDNNGQASLQMQQASDQRKDFGNYMVRRLMEYHLDNYIKTDPQMRPLYETKQKLQDVKVQVNDSIKLNLQYNFSSNIADFYVNNPWVESKISFEMSPGAFGPSSVQEYRIWLNKQISKSLRWINQIAVDDGIVTTQLYKTVFRDVGTSISVSTYFHGNHGDWLRDTTYRENKLALGLSRSF
jgi:hypothetical protein